MDNRSIAVVFRKLGKLLQIQGANPFRVRAYENAAHAVENLIEPAAKLVERDADLTEIEFIGKEMAAHIRELVESGRLSRLEELSAEVPQSLVEVMALSGVGPKKAKRLWQELGVVDVEGVVRAAEAGRIASLAGFGAKSQARILAAAKRLEGSARRRTLLEVDRDAEPLLEVLGAVAGVRRIEVAGSHRRRRETVGDLDLLAVAADPEALMAALRAYPGVTGLLGSGSTKTSVVLASGLQVDLRVVPARSWGAALVYFTGSKSHNIKLRQRALERGLRLSEYGLFNASGLDPETDEGDPWAGRWVGGKTERAVYRALDLPEIPPELREDRGELKAAGEGTLPGRLRRRHLRGDLQVHTTWSDGKDTTEAMVQGALALGYEYLAITDHSPLLAMVGGLDARRVRQQAAEIERLREKYPEIAILKSLEVDILEDGSLDMDDETLESLDLVLVAIHSHFDLPAERQTERLLRALEHPRAQIWAHPLARRFGKRDEIELDLDRVLGRAAELGVVVELNAHPQRLDLSDVHLIRARERGLKVSIATDAHSVAQLDLIRYGVDQARRAWLEPRHVVNTWPFAKLLKTLR